MDDVRICGKHRPTKLPQVSHGSRRSDRQLGSQSDGFGYFAPLQSALSQIGDLFRHWEGIGLDAQSARFVHQRSISQTDQPHRRAGRERRLQRSNDIQQNALRAAEKTDRVEEENSQERFRLSESEPLYDTRRA
jgi:hypothetical protein